MSEEDVCAYTSLPKKNLFRQEKSIFKILNNGR
jgi:hypothetical protein